MKTKLVFAEEVYGIDRANRLISKLSENNEVYVFCLNIDASVKQEFNDNVRVVEADKYVQNDSWSLRILRICTLLKKSRLTSKVADIILSIFNLRYVDLYCDYRMDLNCLYSDALHLLRSGKQVDEIYVFGLYSLPFTSRLVGYLKKNAKTPPDYHVVCRRRGDGLQPLAYGQRSLTSWIIKTYIKQPDTLLLVKDGLDR